MDVTSDLGPFGIVPREAITVAGQIPGRGASTTAIAVYAALATYADRGRDARPSRASIARMIGVSTDTVDRALSSLVVMGLVEVVHRSDERGDLPNAYHLHTMPPGGRTGAAGGSRTDAAQSGPTTTKSEAAGAASVPARVERPRNALADALAAGCNAGELPPPGAKALWRAVGVAVSQIKAIEPDVTPERIVGACLRYPTLGWGAPTPNAVAKWWPRLWHDMPTTGRRTALDDDLAALRAIGRGNVIDTTATVQPPGEPSGGDVVANRGNRWAPDA